VASGAYNGTRIFIGIGRRRRAPASAENFANFRQLPVFHARLLSEYQNQYSYFTDLGLFFQESPQAGRSWENALKTLPRGAAHRIHKAVKRCN
jgi:hypothetical protein